jgi:hypothetical protein
MDVFKVHEQVIEDCRAFTSGFVEVARAQRDQFEARLEHVSEAPQSSNRLI